LHAAAFLASKAQESLLSKNLHILLLLLTATASAVTYRPSNSGIVGPKYAQMAQQWEEWRKESRGLMEIADYGSSIQNRPLRLLLLRRPGPFTRRPALLLTGNMHGGEYLNLEDRLPLEFLRRAQSPGPIRTFLERGGAIVSVPVVNPDGYEQRSRENANGKDLNRDWPHSAHTNPFQESETHSLSRALEALSGSPHNLEFKVTVDYHCCLGAVLYPVAKNFQPNDFTQTFAELARKALGIAIGTTGDLLGYRPIGTAKDYFSERFNAVALTYEGRERIERNFLAEHVKWWEAMAESLLRRAE